MGGMCDGDFADMCANKILLMTMGARAEGLACTDTGVRTPIGLIENFSMTTTLHQENADRILLLILLHLSDLNTHTN